MEFNERQVQIQLVRGYFAKDPYFDFPEGCLMNYETLTPAQAQNIVEVMYYADILFRVEDLVQEALDKECYEAAAMIRDELKNIKNFLGID